MSANNTTYRIFVDGAEDFAFEAKNKMVVIKEAANLIATAKKNKATDTYRVEVKTSADKLVSTFTRRKITKVTKPGTLQIAIDPALYSLVPGGFIAAYERPENETIVFRNENEDAIKATKYLVLHVATQTLAGYAPTTRAAGQIQKKLGVVTKNLKNGVFNEAEDDAEGLTIEELTELVEFENALAE